MNKGEGTSVSDKLRIRLIEATENENQRRAFIEELLDVCLQPTVSIGFIPSIPSTGNLDVVKNLGFLMTAVSRVGRTNLTDMDKAKVQATLIYQEYGILPEILETDREYYSEESNLKTVRDKVFFVSAESPQTTAQTTRILMSQAKLRYSLMHANRVEKATQGRQDLASKIDEVKEEFKSSHNGADPSLNKIAAILNERHISSPNGKSSWHAKTVKRIIEGQGK